MSLNKCKQKYIPIYGTRIINI